MGIFLASFAAGLVSLGAADSEMPAAVHSFLADCEAAGRRLWGASLCAPVAIVDPASGSLRASQPQPAPLPAVRANTAFDWNGQRWIMALEPLPTDEAETRALLFHEAWHVHQKKLGFPGNNAVAGHLENPVSRYLLRLEWAALAKALNAGGARQRAHIAQALAFRRQRIGAGDKLAAAEREQMRHEGLAAYTGIRLSGDPKRLALFELKKGAGRASLGRSFAYVSGPAWGLLLDETTPGWRLKLAGGADLPELMSVAAATVPRADDYRGSDLLGEETLRGLQRQTKLAAALSATAEGRALRLPLGQWNMDFDPNSVSTAPDGSSLYEKITLSDRWGKVRVEGAALRIAPDFSAAFVSWPLSSGGHLELSPGWQVETLPQGGARLVAPTP